LKVIDHKFPSGLDHPLVMLSIDVQTLANNKNIIIDEWEEDGLGTHRGFFIKTHGDFIVLLSQSDHGMQHLGHKGPIVYVDGQDAVNHGYDALLKATLLTFNLSIGQVSREVNCKVEWKNLAKSDLEATRRYRNSLTTRRNRLHKPT